MMWFLNIVLDFVFSWFTPGNKKSHVFLEKKEWSEIISHKLFIGTHEEAVSSSWQVEHGITHVLNVCDDFLKRPCSNVVYEHVEIADSQDVLIRQYFQECIDKMNISMKNDGVLLLHCSAGMSRSPTILMAYFMKMHHMSLQQALHFVRSRHPQTKPNPGFMDDLKWYSHSLDVTKKKAIVNDGMYVPPHKRKL